ncbi:uncharacterized protein [Haliotis asinina]|uniref:uncharacterized protein n=1 Tax=Haliotis asinina TaxID=109174 RepID=UPI0035324A2D
MTLREWQSLLGLLTSAQDLTLRGRLMLRPLQRFLSPFIQMNDLKSRVLLPPHLHQYLRWWMVESNVCVGVCLEDSSHDHELFVDASLLGWGAHLAGRTTSGLWSDAERLWHINNLELQAVILAVRRWLPILSNTKLLVASDNSTVVWVIRNQGTTRSKQLLDQMFVLADLLDSNRITIRVRHIPGCKNILADALSRPGRPSPTEWMLHPDVFRQICLRHGRPLVDLFATSFNHQLPTYVSPVPDPQAWAVDALSLSWEGLDAYAFPPPVLLPEVIGKIKQTQNLRLLLVAPWWPARPWFPDLRRLVSGDPRSQDPMTASPQFVANFLMFLRNSKHLKGSTLGTYLSALNSVLAVKTDRQISKVPELVALLKAFKLEDQKVKFRPPAWDLNVVLQHLRGSPYEPLEDASFELLSRKTVFLLALATAARVSEIHALDVTQVRFEQARHGRVHLGLLWDFIAKNQLPGQPDRRFSIPPLSTILGRHDTEEEFLCPVRALRYYIQRSALKRHSRKRLFIPFSSSCKGEVNRNTIALWLRATILAAYDAKKLPHPTANNPHEIRALASTMALHRNCTIERPQL